MVVAVPKGAAFGAAGQRCMAISAAVFVGGFDKWRQPLLDHAKSLKVCDITLSSKKKGCFTPTSPLQVGAGIEADTDVGPLISRESMARCEKLIQSGVDQGAACLLDGRGVKVCCALDLFSLAWSNFT